MIKNALSFSQPLNSMRYNEHLAQKMQGNQANTGINQMNMNQVMGMGSGGARSGQNASQSNILDEAGFASELRSLKTVSALMHATNAQVPTTQSNTTQDSTQNFSQNTQTIQPTQTAEIMEQATNPNARQAPRQRQTLGLSMPQRQNITEDGNISSQTMAHTQSSNQGVKQMSNHKPASEQSHDPWAQQLINQRPLSNQGMFASGMSAQSMQNSQNTTMQNTPMQNMNALLPQTRIQNGASSPLGPTLGEKGLAIDISGKIYMPQDMPYANPEYVNMAQHNPKTYAYLEPQSPQHLAHEITHPLSARPSDAISTPSQSTQTNTQTSQTSEASISRTPQEDADLARMIKYAIPLKDNSMGIPLKHSVTMPMTNQTHAEVYGTQNSPTQSPDIAHPVATTQVNSINTTNASHAMTNMQQNTTAGISLRGRQAFALDSRSLNILSRVAAKNAPANNASNVSPSMTTQTSLNTEANTPIINQNLYANGNYPHLAQSNIPHTTQSVNNTNNTTLQALLTPQDRQVVETTSHNIQLGNLAKQYESGSKGSSAIGYDRHGGTSYGTYQISSRAGTFTEFLKFLDTNEPEWASQLRNAGPANTGSRNGAVPKVWKELVAENPERMEKLEYDFIVQTHYQPVANYVEEKWAGEMSSSLQEVIFSTAVQHGVNGAKRVFNQAFASTPIQSLAQEELIKNVYTHRSTKFASSTPQVQESARNRFVHEQRAALAELI